MADVVHFPEKGGSSRDYDIFLEILEGRYRDDAWTFACAEIEKLKIEPGEVKLMNVLDCYINTYSTHAALFRSPDGKEILARRYDRDYDIVYYYRPSDFPEYRDFYPEKAELLFRNGDYLYIKYCRPDLRRIMNW